MAAKGIHPSWAEHSERTADQWYVVVQGKFAKIARKIFDPPLRPSRRKGAISGFSPSARFRMLQWISRVDWSLIKDSRFITLTYPDSLADTTYRDRATHRYLIHRYMERAKGKHLSLLWRTEWQKRKTGLHAGLHIPHHHLLVFSLGYLSNEVVRGWWRGILRADGPLSTDVRKCPDDERASWYVAKYAAKLPHLDVVSYLNNMQMTGRQWGVARKGLVPMSPRFVSRMLNADEIAAAKRLGAEFCSRYGEFGEGGFSVLGTDRVEMVKEIFALAIAE